MNYGSMLKIIAVLAFGAIGLCAQNVVSPESDVPKPGSPALTAMEREMLMSLTRVRTGDGGGEAPVARQEQAEGEHINVAALVEKVDQLLARLSRSSKDGDHILILQLMGSPRLAVRATALNWAVSVGSIAADALFKGINDEEELVRESAFTHLLGFGVTQAAIEQMRVKVNEGQDMASSRDDIRLAVASRKRAAR